MLRHRITPLLVAAALVAGAVGVGPVAAQNPPPEEIRPPVNNVPANDAPADNENYEALTRGPVHEAFANPYASSPEAGLIVQKEPPAPIDEIPPEMAPAGENVLWIPGYWGWEPEEQDFIWISGLWRDVPPERRWVPGYWTEAQGGQQWISGFWASAKSEELSYLPNPPESQERGPNVASPDGDYFWSPGCWIWAETDYQWRPGYWAEAHPGWVWVPDYHTWTPYGCIFVNGYWDRDFTHRGTLFTPVRFTHRDRGYRYVPRVTVDLSVVLVHLFVSRPYGHYRFGDYYAVNDSRFGIVPWVAYENRRNWYDPLLTYYQWSYGRRGVDLGERLGAWNQYYVQHENLRPPRTFKAQRQFRARFEGQENVPFAQSVFAQPLQEIVATEEGRRQFRQLPENVRRQAAQSAEQFQQIGQQRARLEVASSTQETPAPQPGEERARVRPERKLELPQSLTTLKPPAGADQPQTPEAADPQRPGETPGQPGAEQPGQPPRRPGQVPPPARPPGTQPNVPPSERPRDDEPRPEQPRPEQPRPEQPRPEQPRPEQPRPEQPRPETPDRPERPRETPPGTRPDDRPQPNPPRTQPNPPGTRPDARDPGDPARRIPRFNFRRPEGQQPRQQPGQNQPRVDPRGRRGFDAPPPGQRGQDPRRGQPPAGAPEQGRPQPGEPQPGSPPSGNRPPEKKPKNPPGQGGKPGRNR